MATKASCRVWFYRLKKCELSNVQLNNTSCCFFDTFFNTECNNHRDVPFTLALYTCRRKFSNPSIDTCQSAFSVYAFLVIARRYYTWRLSGNREVICVSIARVNIANPRFARRTYSLHECVAVQVYHRFLRAACCLSCALRREPIWDNRMDVYMEILCAGEESLRGFFEGGRCDYIQVA